MRANRIDHLRNMVGFEAYAWLLTDPVSEVGSSPLADVPCLPELPELIRLKYLTDINRWTSLDSPVASLRATTGDRREQSAVWRGLQARYDIGDVASLVFRDRFGCWGFLDLWRAGSEARFSIGEIARLQRLVEPITDELRRAVAGTFVDVPSPGIRGGPAVIVLSPTLEPRAQTPETDALLRTLLPTETDRRPVPAGAFNVAAQLLAAEAGVDGHPPSTRVHLGNGRWLTLRAARVSADGTAPDSDIAVTLEPSTPAERGELFARSHALTERETELLDHLVAGADTRSVASRMFVSEHTVQDHLKSIFAKTGTRNRRMLLARITGR